MSLRWLDQLLWRRRHRITPNVRPNAPQTPRHMLPACPVDTDRSGVDR